MIKGIFSINKLKNKIKVKLCLTCKLTQEFLCLMAIEICCRRSMLSKLSLSPKSHIEAINLVLSTPMESGLMKSRGERLI